MEELKMVVIEMENGKKIKLELYPEHAPITVANFERLVKNGFYDGLIFHRVIRGFMIQLVARKATFTHPTAADQTQRASCLSHRYHSVHE